VVRPATEAVTRSTVNRLGTEPRPAHVGFRLMKADEHVVVTVVSGEPEAEIACGLLRSSGIACAYRETTAIESTLEDFTAAGPREILVRAADLEAARQLLIGSG
jgi:hypothetical protein